MESTLYLVLIGLLSVFLVSQAADIDLSNIDVNDLKNQLHDEFPKSNLTIDDAKILVKDKCLRVAGEEEGLKAFNEIEASIVTLGECFNNIVNYTVIQEEIQTASPKGELDVVFNKYCLKRPEAIKCIEAFNSKLSPCLDKEESENQDVFMRIIRSLLNFICHKGGDQIALFIAEKGPECLEEHKEDIQNCINSTFSRYIPDEGIENIKSLPKFIMGAQQCDDMENLETCIVKKLETCEEITPANIVESMFRFIKNETICRTVAKANKHTASSACYSTTMCLNIMLMVIFTTAVTYLSRKTIS